MTPTFLNILAVEDDAFGVGDVVAAADLPEAGHAGAPLINQAVSASTLRHGAVGAVTGAARPIER